VPDDLESTETAKLAAREALKSTAAMDSAFVRAAGRVKSVLSRAALKGDTEAQNLAGAIALEIEQSPKEARRWFEMAAASGDRAARRSLGSLYANGQGVRADIPKAMELFRLAADAGDPYAAHNLAAVNVKLEGAYFSLEETLTLLRSAADGGVVEATALLADVLAANDQDSEALDLYVKAASQGHAGAMKAAACWFRDGTAGEPNPVQSVRWFLAMLNYGNGDGVHEAIKVASGMSADQIREAARLAGRPGEGESLLAMISR